MKYEVGNIIILDKELIKSRHNINFINKEIKGKIIDIRPEEKQPYKVEMYEPVIEGEYFLIF